MGNRLSKIYTRTGDDGSTGLGDGQRIEKDHARVEVMGSVDELNSLIGLLQTELQPDDSLAETLSAIQHDLFDLGGELSIPGYQLVDQARVDWLEAQLDAINEHLPPLKNFILPGGSKAAAWCHYARTVCRRAERNLVTLRRETATSDTGSRYLNRLSDLLFVMARSLARRDGGTEVLWRQRDTSRS